MTSIFIGVVKTNLLQISRFIDSERSTETFTIRDVKIRFRRGTIVFLQSVVRKFQLFSNPERDREMARTIVAFSQNEHL